MKDPDPSDAVADLRDFLSSTKPDVGRKCQTCRHPQHTLIDAVLEEFAKGRASGAISMPFAFVHEKHLRARYPGIPSVDSVKRHARNCLGLEVT